MTLNITFFGCTPKWIQSWQRIDAKVWKAKLWWIKLSVLMAKVKVGNLLSWLINQGLKKGEWTKLQGEWKKMSHPWNGKRPQNHLCGYYMGYAKGLYMQVSSKNMKAYMGRVITPLKFNMGPKNWWLVDVSPFPFGGGYFSRKHNYSFKAASLKVQGGPLQGYRWGYNNPHKQGKKRHLPFFSGHVHFFLGTLILR